MRLERLKLVAQKADSGGGVLGKGSEPHHHQLEGLGRAVNSKVGFGAKPQPPRVLMLFVF